MTEKIYQERLNRYITAMRNDMPDCIPIRPFVAEFTAKYAGYTCQEVTHDYKKAFEAVIKCAKDFDWDAMVPNMVYVWTGLTQALGLKYYATPGIEIPPDVGFQYLEPEEEKAFMKADEYDQLINDPTYFLYNVWLPRISTEINGRNSYRTKLALVKGSIAMFQYFNDLSNQVKRMKEEIGMPSAICGILKAPLDIIADKLRGYIGLIMDLHTQPENVLKSCEVLAPHLAKVAEMTSDPEKKLPVGFWMHRGCVPFINMEQFKTIYWPTLKPIVEELWSKGIQTLFYAEGNWDVHLDSFLELPEGSIIYHVDKGDIFNVHRKIGEKFCISGGLPNTLLAIGSEKEVKQYCKKIIDNVGRNGGYIMDASAIIQNDAKIENIRVMTEFTREYGVYSQGRSRVNEEKGVYKVKSELKEVKIKPGVCIPWQEKKNEIQEIKGDEDLIKRIWEEIDSLDYIFIWQLLLSF